MKQTLRPTLAVIAAIAVLGVAGISPAQAKSSATTHVDKNKASVVVGYELAGRFPTWARSLIDPEAVGKAVTRALEGKQPSMSQSEAVKVASAFKDEFEARAKQHYEQVAAANKKAGEAYLAKNKHKSGVHVTKDGLQYQVISKGKGPKPKATDTVEVNYSGAFVDGKVFDASSRHGSGPSKLSLTSVIPGIREAVMMMPVGSHYKFVIPPQLAYGSQPKNGFPPNATLVFDVTLVKIDKDSGK